jgi:hypothetical protein
MSYPPAATAPNAAYLLGLEHLSTETAALIIIIKEE